MSLEDIERKFYSQPIEEKKEVKTPETTPISDSSQETTPLEQATPAPTPQAQSPWAEAKESGSGKVVKIFTISVISLVVLGGILGGVWAFTKFFGAPDGVVASLEIYSPLQTQRGVPFEARVEVTNETERPISGTLKISLSSGLLQSGETLEIEEAISEIPAQGVYEKKIPLYAVGDIGANEKISAEFSDGDNTTSNEKEIYIRESGIRLTAEKKQIQGENSKFELTVKYENVSGVSFKDASIELRYPNAFSFVSASPSPSEGKGVWRLGEVKNKSEGTIVIIGTLAQSGVSSVGVPVLFKTSVDGEQFTLAETSALLSATQSPILISIKGEGKEDYIARAGAPAPYVFHITNNTDAGLADVVVLVTLNSPMFDFAKVTTQGTYNSAEHTVRFTAAQVSKLRALSAKDSVDVSVSAGLLKDFPMKTENDKNYTLKGTVEVTSPTVPHNSTADKTFVLVPFEHKVAGNATIMAQAWRKDPWGMINGGTLPLTPNKPTQYTVHWTLKNYATDLKNVKIESSLPPGVSFTGVVRSNAPTSPEVNERTGLVTWTLPLVSAGKGVVNSAYEAVFQIEVLPNLTQAGSQLRLLEQTNLTATDVWTGTTITNRFDKLDSSIPHDPTFKKGDETVIK